MDANSRVGKRDFVLVRADLELDGLGVEGGELPDHEAQHVVIMDGRREDGPMCTYACGCMWHYGRYLTSRSNVT